MEHYGLYKHLATENHYLSLTKSINSAYNTEETRKTIKRITKSGIRYAHMGQLVIKDGICYATFIQNPGDDGEAHDSVTSGVVLAVFALADVLSDRFDPETDVTVYPIGSLGGTCAGQTAHSIFKDNSMCLVGEDLYICFSFITDDNRSHIFSKAFHTADKTWGTEAAVRLSYKGELSDFSDETLNRIYRDKGLEPRAEGLIELVSAWSEYKGEYYATGVTIEKPNNGFVVKTTDFAVMTLVDTVPFNDCGMCEIASTIYKGKLFVACRQDYGIPYLTLGFYDLEAHEWRNHYKLPDGNSRPWFFIKDDKLFLLNTVEELDRRYTNISRVRVLDTDFDFFNHNIPVETLATIKGCGCYFATANYKEDIYFVCTNDTENFGRLSLLFADEEKVNRKLCELFRDEVTGR